MSVQSVQVTQSGPRQVCGVRHVDVVSWILGGFVRETYVKDWRKKRKWGEDGVDFPRQEPRHTPGGWRTEGGWWGTWSDTWRTMKCRSNRRIRFYEKWKKKFFLLFLYHEFSVFYTSMLWESFMVPLLLFFFHDLMTHLSYQHPHSQHKLFIINCFRQKKAPLQLLYVLYVIYIPSLSSRTAGVYTYSYIFFKKKNIKIKKSQRRGQRVIEGGKKIGVQNSNNTFMFSVFLCL